MVFTVEVRTDIAGKCRTEPNYFYYNERVVPIRPMLSPEASNIVGNGTAQGPNTFSAIVVELSGTIGDLLELGSVIAVVLSLISTSSENRGKKSKKSRCALDADLPNEI
jgi:hypothetical protein